MENDYINGAISDPRTEEQKAKDYDHSDFVGGAIINWVEKKPLTLSLRKQSSSWSCGSQCLAKLLEFSKHDVESATPLYRYRKNFPNMGMFMQDIGDIAIGKLTTTEALCASQNMTEEEMNSAEIPEVNVGGFSAYYFLPKGQDTNLDLVAQALDNGHSLIIGISSNMDEWNRNVPEYKGQQTTFNHFVACYPSNYTLHNGEKAIYIDDSCLAESTLNGQRILTETFLKERCFGIMALKPSTSSVVAFKHTFPTGLVLRKGSTGVEVVALQTILIYEGFLKKGLATGYYGTLTEQAVKKLQQHYADTILTPAGLTAPTGVCAGRTFGFLNSKYS